MRCNNEDLMMYVYDELEPARRRALEGHLAECAECAREAEALRATAAAVRDGAPVPGPSPELEERIRVRAAALISRPAPLWKRLPALPRTALMSGVAAALLFTALLVRQPAGTGTVDAQTAWHDAFYAEVVRLASGTTDTTTTGDAVLDQLDTDLEQLYLALASY